MSLFGLFGRGKRGPEEPVYTDPLPGDPEAIALAFCADHTAWNAFAAASHAKSGDFTAAEATYDRLIALYCGPEKEHLLLAFGGDSRFEPEGAAVTGREEGAGGCTIFLRHTNAHDFVAEYEFVFRQERERWLLDEVYYLDDYGGEKLPSL